MKKLLIGLAVLSIAASSYAAVLASDDFSYVGDLSDNGWNNYSGTGGVASDGSVASFGAVSADLNLASAFADQGSGDVFASFILNVSSAGAGSYAFGFQDGTSMESRFGILSGSDFTVDSYGAGTSSLGSSGSLSESTDYTITLGYNATTFTHSLWIDAAPGDEASPDVAIVNGSNTGIDNFFFREGSGDSTYTVGSFAVGENFSDVVTAVPEPATMSLLGLGALAMVLRRKMKK